MHRSAIFSLDKRLRYVLTRQWSEGDLMVLWIMLNPSIASAEYNDPTIRRCITFSQDWGYDGMYVVNPFPQRTPKPAELCEMKKGETYQNMQYISLYQKLASKNICAWGNQQVLSRMDTDFSFMNSGHSYYYLKLSKSGVPVHPLYLPKGLRPMKWSSNKINQFCKSIK